MVDEDGRQWMAVIQRLPAPATPILRSPRGRPIGRPERPPRARRVPAFRAIVLLVGLTALIVGGCSPQRRPLPSSRDVSLLPFAEVREAAGQNAYVSLDAETLSRAANGPLMDQRMRIDGLVRRAQEAGGDAYYAANGWRAHNWLSVDTAPGATVDGQISVLYNGDASSLQVGQPVTVFGRAEGYDPTTTNGFGAKPNPPLVVAEYVSRAGDIPIAPRPTSNLASGALATPAPAPAAGPLATAAPASSAPAIAAPAPPPSPPATAAPTTATARASRTTLNVQGQGTTTTDNFAVSGDWNLAWSYNCSAFGSRGNFQVFVHNGDSSPSRENAPVNQAGSSGSGTERYHRAGTYYLVVNSECEWQLQVEA